MATTNVVAAVRTHLAKAIKAKSSTIQTPAKWAADAGFTGSAASPLRKHMARDSGNGCGRQGRYPAMSAEELLEVLDLADAFAAEQDAKKRTVKQRAIRSHLRPAAKKGGRQAKASGAARAKKAATPEDTEVEFDLA